MGLFTFETRICERIIHGAVEFCSWETKSIIIQEVSISTGETLVFQVILGLTEEGTGMHTNKSQRIQIESFLTSDALIFDSAESFAFLGSIRDAFISFQITVVMTTQTSVLIRGFYQTIEIESGNTGISFEIELVIANKTVTLVFAEGFTVFDFFSFAETIGESEMEITFNTEVIMMIVINTSFDFVNRLRHFTKAIGKSISIETGSTVSIRISAFTQHGHSIDVNTFLVNQFVSSITGQTTSKFCRIGEDTITERVQQTISMGIQRESIITFDTFVGVHISGHTVAHWSIRRAFLG